MKKLVITIVCALFVMGARAQETTVNTTMTPEELVASLNDFKYMEMKKKSERYRWHITAAVDGRDVIIAGKYPRGHYVALTGGVKMIDGAFRPTIGFEVGGERKWLGWFVQPKWLSGHYTDDADYHAPYTELDFTAGLKVKVWETKDRTFGVWFRPFINYEFRSDYHENVWEKETTTETETEIIHVKETTENDALFKGSPLGGGAGLEAVYTPYWSNWSFRLNGWYGWQQYYYSSGSKWHGEWGVEFKVAYTIDANELWNTKVLDALHITKSQAKKLAKANRAIQAY